MQEPFKSVPLIWTIHEKSLGTRLTHYLSNNQIEFVDDWKQVFNRASVVVFPNHVLPVTFRGQVSLHVNLSRCRILCGSLSSWLKSHDYMII